MHDIQAHLRSLSMSAQKVRLVVDLVRGKNANEALEMLRFVNKAAALPVRKLIASAVANAEPDHDAGHADEQRKRDRRNQQEDVVNGAR